VPRMKGMVLMERDRALLGYLGVARYVTAAQAHRLIAPGHDKAIVSRRLARLCERGPNPGDDAYLRRIEYQRPNGLPFPVWALTPHGRVVAEAEAPGPVAAVQPGVGVQFVERVVALNEILLALALATRKSESAPLTALPFRWRVADEPIRFEVLDRATGRTRPAVLRPDAILEVAGRQRRIFLEAEAGASGLAPRDARQGHAKRRLDRYVTFFISYADRDMTRTWYRAAFGDGFAAEVVFLVLSEARRARVERVIHECMGSGQHRFGVRSLTLASAAAALAPVVAPQPTALPPGQAAAAASRPPTAPGVRTVAVDHDLAVRLRGGMSAWFDAYRAMRYRLNEHAARCPSRFELPPPPVGELAAFAEVIWQRLLGVPECPRFWKL